MGSRANLVIVGDDGYELFYDHWAAQSLPVNLFFGPGPAERFIRGCQATDEWLDDRWCEGAVLYDPGRKHLLFFGGEDAAYNVGLRRCWFDLMSPLWPGWTLRWASEGLGDIADRLAIGRERVRSGREPHPPAAPRLRAGDPISVVTIGSQRYGLANGVADVLLAGPPVLSKIARLGGRKFSCLEMPYGGVHFDRELRQLLFWEANTCQDLPERARPHWPGWQFCFVGDRYEDHEALCPGMQLPVCDWDRRAEEVKRWVCRQPGDPLSFVDTMEQHFRDSGQTVEVNPLMWDANVLDLSMQQRCQLFRYALDRARPA